MEILNDFSTKKRKEIYNEIKAKIDKENSMIQLHYTKEQKQTVFVVLF